MSAILAGVHIDPPIEMVPVEDLSERERRIIRREQNKRDEKDSTPRGTMTRSKRAALEQSGPPPKAPRRELLPLVVTIDNPQANESMTPRPSFEDMAEVDEVLDYEPPSSPRVSAGNRLAPVPDPDSPNLRGGRGEERYGDEEEDE